jgi:hypothetical protein
MKPCACLPTPTQLLCLSLFPTLFCVSPITLLSFQLGLPAAYLMCQTDNEFIFHEYKIFCRDSETING